MIQATVEFKKPAHGQIRAHREAIRFGLQAGMVALWKDALPGHFEPFATRRYGWQGRNAGYMRYKAKKKGHQNPLMWSGVLRQAILGHKPKTLFRQGVAYMRFGNLPYYAKMRGDMGTNPDMMEELQQLDDRDRQIILDAVNKGYAYKMRALLTGGPLAAAGALGEVA